VDPKLSVEYLTYLQDRVMEFMATFDEFMSVHSQNTSLARGLAPAVFPLDGSDPEQIRALTTKLNFIAGQMKDLSEIVNLTIGVQGVGIVDPFILWETITKPKPVLEAADVLGACNQALGRLDAMIHRATAVAAPLLDPRGFHPLVWAPAERLWHDGHLRQAVQASSDALVAHVKTLTGRNDVPETALWQEVFSDKPPEPGKPRLRWPGDPKDRNVGTMNGGLRQFSPGVQMTIRNPATHVAEDLVEQDALERMAVLSLLARWLDQCEVVGAKD
jgi:hypothetical protein